MSITGEPGGPPVKVGVPLTDLGAGLFALSAILAALHLPDAHRAAGQYIDTSLVEAGVALSVWEATEYLQRRRRAAADGIGAPDERAVSGDSLRRRLHHAGRRQRPAVSARLCELLDRREWSSDPEFPDDTQRVRNRARLAREIEAITVLQPRRYWLAKLDEATACRAVRSTTTRRCSPIRRSSRANWWSKPTIPRWEPMRTLGAAMKMSRTPAIVGRPAPLLGEHTTEVLREMGYADEAIAALAAGNPSQGGR